MECLYYFKHSFFVFFDIYMTLGLQKELDEILGRKTQRYYIAYLLGIPTLFIYTLVWMANISEELKNKAIELEIEGKHTSFWHMFGRNVFGVLFFGPMIATYRFFNTLNKIICTAGEGWYQEEGKEAQSLVPGTVVSIPPNVKHWHGAKKDSWFSHLAIEVPGENTSNEWCEPVDDEHYNAL